MNPSTFSVVGGVAAQGLGMLAVERMRPGCAWPPVVGWWSRALVLNAAQVLSVLCLGALWDRSLFRHRPWSADDLGVVGGGLIGYVAVTFVFYWWHRARHASPILWRWFHQIHHSPQRIEVLSAFYKHPLEIAANGFLTSAVLYVGVGLDLPAATVAVLLTGVAELFYHWNVSTPRWLGWLVQRPESHRLHHQEGLHHFNYADLPVWDMLFGTFRNPVAWRGRCGLGAGRESRLFAMLGGKDVSAAAVSPGRGRAPAILLIALGLGQMAGDVGGLPALRGVAAATAAAPAPKVFSAVRGLETYSAAFALEWTDRAGRARELPLTADVYRRLRGPYNRRNVYGAVLAFGPVLPERLRDPVMRYALCGAAPLLREIGIDPPATDGFFRVRVVPRPGSHLGPVLYVTGTCQ